MEKNNLTFVSCDCCMGKGPLELCEGCVHNRNVIEEYNRLLQKEKNKSRFEIDFDFVSGIIALISVLALIACLFFFDQLSVQIIDLEAQNSGLMDNLSRANRERDEAQNKSKEFLEEAIRCYREMDVNEKEIEE